MSNQRLIEASENALALLNRIQSQEESDPMPMPWPEIDELEMAIRQAEEPKRFHCAGNNCGDEFEDWKALVVHVRDNHPDDEVGCLSDTLDDYDRATGTAL